MNKFATSCPVCTAGRYSPSYKIREYTYGYCNSCGMLYIRPDLLKSDNEQYDSDYFKDALKENMSGYMDYAQQSAPLRMNFRKILSRIHPYLSPDTPNSMLDIGCAYGFFLDEARKVGFSVQGVDVSENAIKWMENNLGIKGTVGESSDAPIGPFDLITATEIIEHIHDLHLFLDDIYQRLREGGILVILTGANDAPTARLLGKRWWYLNPPDHCSIFSRPALKKLISDKGFNILEHHLVPFHWVGLNNMILKVARILESNKLGGIASRLPPIIIPVFHYSTQCLIAKKG